MANDETSQVIELEVNTVRYLLKGSIEMIKVLGQRLIAFGKWSGKTVHDTVDNRSGERRYGFILAHSQGAPQVVQVPENLYNSPEFEEFIKKNKLQYCAGIPDFDSEDKRKPILIKSQDLAIFNEFIKPYADKLINEMESSKTGYDKTIEELNEKLNNPNLSKEEREQLRIDLENTKIAKEQLQVCLDKNIQYNEHGNAMSFVDYMKQGEKTEFAKDPSLALAKLSEGIEISKEFGLLEAMTPIRDKTAVPDEGKAFITYKADGRSIEAVRSFDTSKGYVTSTYEFDVDGKKFTITDENLGNNWKEAFEKQLKENGLTDTEINQFMYRVDRSVNSRDAYITYQESPELQAKVEKTARQDNSIPAKEYQDEQTENMPPKELSGWEDDKDNEIAAKNAEISVEQPKIELTEEGKKFKDALAENRTDKIEQQQHNGFKISIDSVKLITKDSTSMGVNFDGIGVVNDVAQIKDTDGNFKIAIQYDRTYDVDAPDGTKTQMTGGQIRDQLDSMRTQKQNIPSPTQNITQGKGR